MKDRNNYRVAVFTFDHTICREPTFFFFKNLVVDYDQRRKDDLLRHFHFNQADYECGKKDAPGMIKTGVSSWFLHNEQYLSAIATFHAYPDYIAGYLAHILGKELTRLDKHSVTPEEKTLIATYAVEGERRPILISYLNPLHDRGVAIDSFTWKTKQLEQLRQVMLDNSWIAGEDMMHFYEGVCSHSQCGEGSCGIPKEAGYTPKISQLSLERSSSTRMGFVTVHRVSPGDEFQASPTLEEMEILHPPRAAASSPIPVSSDRRPTLLLAGWGLFAVTAAILGCAVLKGEAKDSEPRWMP
ncbi:hypothetical protein [Legionella sp. CNM-4043-24]|uniref:hypothetical protein n=1 Tax=Legionella sp. CNM-4043-24 TaxID=3421646 RepID=UPI00403B1C68